MVSGAFEGRPGGKVTFRYLTLCLPFSEPEQCQRQSPGPAGKHFTADAIEADVDNVWEILTWTLYPGAPPRRLKLGDGDQAAAKPGFYSEGNPYQKPKTRRIWPTVFLKMGGLSPALSKMGDASPPPCYGAPGYTLHA